MIDPDELQAELEAEEQHLQKLLIRTKQQERDIQELKEELTRFKEDLEPISPEQWDEHLRSGVAQS